MGRRRADEVSVGGLDHAKGAKIRVEPTSYPWALELQVEDPDGNVLRLGSEPRKDQPFGEWRDMRSEPWRWSPDGGWKRVQPDEGRGPATP